MRDCEVTIFGEEYDCSGIRVGQDVNILGVIWDVGSKWVIKDWRWDCPLRCSGGDGSIC